VAKANYHQIRRQKELARKTRQQEKKQKRQALKAGEPNADEPETSELSTSDSTAAETIDAGSQSTDSVDQPVTDSAGSAAGQSSTRS
jgi:hypothetical protein